MLSAAQANALLNAYTDALRGANTARKGSKRQRNFGWTASVYRAQIVAHLTDASTSETAA